MALVFLSASNGHLSVHNYQLQSFSYISAHNNSIVSTSIAINIIAYIIKLEVIIY